MKKYKLIFCGVVTTVFMVLLCGFMPTIKAASVNDITDNNAVLASASSSSSTTLNVDSTGINNFTNVKYIDNANYFKANPYHATNDGSDNAAGTCTTVAMQMLMGYHNYYTDRRLIPELGGNGLRYLSTDYANQLDNPKINSSTAFGYGRASIGTEVGFYEELMDFNFMSGTYGIGQAVGLVVDGAKLFVAEYASNIKNDVSITSGLFDITTAKSDIDSGKPIILASQPIFTGASDFHVVVAYGYAKYNGEDGFIVHCGGTNSEVHIWYPASWFGFQIRMSINHTHNIVDTMYDIDSTHRRISCSTCGFTGVDDIYEVDSNGSSIIGAKYYLGGNISIPSKINDVTIVSIANNAFKSNQDISNIIITNTITNIDSYAFEGCTNLESVKLSNSLYAIGVGAFKGCTNLEEIEIPASVQHIDSSAFENCSTLREVRVKKSKEAITHIGENAFDGCSSSLQIIVPKNRLAEYKNKVYWSSYENKIIPDSAVFEELDLHCLVDNLNNVTLSAGYNKLYKLNVECNKSYKFTTSTGVELKVYDEYFDELYTGENILYAYLSPGTYYLDVRYNSSATSGTITIDYELRWTHDGERVSYNDDHNLLTHLHETSDGTYLNKLYYINNNGAGLYKFQLNGSYSNNSPIVYDAGTLTVYNESGRLETQLLNRYPNSSIMASLDDNQDVMYVYLPRNGYFYINIVMPSESYETLSLTISPVESETIDLLSSMTSTFTEDLAIDNNLEEYAKKLIINQTSKYLITLNSKDALSNNFDIIMFKQTYSSSSNAYYTNFKSINYITNTSTQKTFEVSLDVGVYFIYYYGNDTNVNIDLTLTRVLQNNNDRAYAMQADPAGSGYNPGSEVKFNNGSRNNYTITEGFTRNMFFVLEDFYTYSRLDFDWYSSNVNVATVSEFGTVFANSVSSNQIVTIYAVYKEDPSLIYYRTFTVVDDTSEEEIVITCNMSYSYSEENGEYQIELTDDNSPYPMIQYYDWSVYVPCQETDITCSMNTWGEITASGPGYATLTGTYTINPRVTIIINLSIIE